MNLAWLGVRIDPGPGETIEISLPHWGPRIRRDGKVVSLEALRDDIALLYTVAGRTPPPAAQEWLFGSTQVAR